MERPFKTVENNPYRNKNNVLLLRGLFLETSSNPDTVIYTLKDHDHRGYPSLKRLYLETADPTEYTFAITHLESWPHWKMLTEASWFEPTIAIWREELELKLRAEALSTIIKTAKGDTRDALQASKYIADKGYDKEKSTKGRPSKEQIARAAFDLAEDHTQVEQDFERLKLVK